MARLVSALLLLMFLFVALFGLTFLLSHSGHHEGCPLAAVGEVMCESTIFEHVSIWNGMLVSIASALLVVAIFIAWHSPIPQQTVERVRLRRILSAQRPTLFQELYSRGILNRKEPYAFSWTI